MSQKFPFDGAEVRELKNSHTWSEVEAALNEKYSLIGTPLEIKTANPVRDLMRTWERDQKSGDKKVGPRSAAKVVELRDKKGYGFARLASATGLKIAEVKSLYAKGGGKFPSGRVYVARDGSVTHVTDSTLAIHEARAEAAKKAKATKKAA